jgi:ribonuclease BN (tRNA processing enzyme)
MERDGVSLVIATDVEAGTPESDGEIARFAAGTDLLIYDAQYLPQEQETIRVGWGHSTWKSAAELAREAGVKRLILTSHDPGRSDDEVDQITDCARTVFANTDAAAEGMAIEVG